MFKIMAKVKSKRFCLLLFAFLLFTFYFPLVLAGSLWAAGDKTETANAIEDVWDPAKYIGIDEIRPGMEAYCLTVYRGAEIEKFGLEVLDVVRNVRPGRDAILVQGTDERFIHTGPVAGCSGSPVYIEGRLAGALAFGWTFSKDPLYGVTPIKEILSVGQVKPSGQSVEQMGFSFDFSKPIDFADIDAQIKDGLARKNNNPVGITALPCLLITSGLPAKVCERLGALVEPFGLMVVTGVGGGGVVPRATSDEPRATKLAPGACLVVPLVTGDIVMEVIATVTEVVDDKIYGFGHSFLRQGHGPVDLPMATGQVHTVVSRVTDSFKFASSLEIVGALMTDESAAVYGQIGAKAQMFPLTITVDRYNDPEKRVYNCQVANNRLLTPVVLSSAVAGATLMLGRLPPNHMIEYKVAIAIEDAEPIIFENVSTNRGLEEMLIEGTGSVAILLNNPYRKVNIESIDFNVRLMPKNVSSRIWSVDLSDSTVKAGQQLDVTVVVESFLAEKKKYQLSLKIPDELTPGKYDLIVCGGYGYQEFLKKTVPYRFVPQNLATLVEVMNNLLTIGRDKLYCLLVLPPSGVAVEKAELPDLPATKALVLQDAKRALRTQPHPHWLESSSATGTVIIDKKVMHITVEE